MQPDRPTRTKKLLVLDVDETLIHASESILDRPPDFMVFGYSVYRRPHLSNFLAVCFEHFEVGVWSSASDDYLAEVVQTIFPDPDRLRFAWGVSRTCRRFVRPETAYGWDATSGEVHYLKPLEKLKRRFGRSLKDMIVVGDTPQKASENYGNAIYPIQFFDDFEDDELQLLASYLITLKDRTDIRKLEKRTWRSGVVPMPR
jgi:carboxy-terminal domain RNA polymerase II polypeptide A small phosphatase